MNINRSIVFFFRRTAKNELRVYRTQAASDTTSLGSWPERGDEDSRGGEKVLHQDKSE